MQKFLRFAPLLLGVLLIGLELGHRVDAASAPVLYPQPNWQPPGPVNSLPPACADGPCMSLDAGTDFVCYFTPLSSLQLTGGSTANVNYRVTLDPDGGTFASAADTPLFATQTVLKTLQPVSTFAVTDGGKSLAAVSMHLSAADALASASHCP